MVELCPAVAPDSPPLFSWHSWPVCLMPGASLQATDQVRRVGELIVFTDIALFSKEISYLIFQNILVCVKTKPSFPKKTPDLTYITHCEHIANPYLLFTASVFSLHSHIVSQSMTDIALFINMYKTASYIFFLIYTQAKIRSTVIWFSHICRHVSFGSCYFCILWQYFCQKITNIK